MGDPRMGFCKGVAVMIRRRGTLVQVILLSGNGPGRLL